MSLEELWGLEFSTSTCLEYHVLEGLKPRPKYLGLLMRDQYTLGKIERHHSCSMCVMFFCSPSHASDAHERVFAVRDILKTFETILTFGDHVSDQLDWPFNRRHCRSTP